MNTNNLFEQLSPENQKKASEYPSLVNSLKSLKGWNDLTIYHLHQLDVCDLIHFHELGLETGLKHGQLVSQLTKIFEP